MNLWDTAGQEKFFALTKMYVQDAVGIIFVYDITYAESLEGVKVWHKQVLENLNINQCAVALVGNKSDMLEQTQVSNKQAKQLQQEIQADICMEVSAKENRNIQELLEKMAKLLMEKEDSRDRSQSRILGGE